MATFSVLTRGDVQADAALASEVDCPPARSLTAPGDRSQSRGAVGAALPRLSGSRRLADAGKWLADDSYFVEPGASGGLGDTPRRPAVAHRGDPGVSVARTLSAVLAAAGLLDMLSDLRLMRR